VTKHLGELKEQAFASAREANEKFVSDSEAFMSYGSEQEFEEGLCWLPVCVCVCVYVCVCVCVFVCVYIYVCMYKLTYDI
jgi:hypothetical protein